MEEGSDREEQPAAERRGGRWPQILLLLPLPPATFLYLHLVRAARVTPSFLPVIVLALFPLASILLASRRLGATPVAERPLASEIALVAIAITELAWAAVSAAAVAMTLAARSG